MTRVFVFLGEFGYELFNWQGVVRKLQANRPNDRVVCASRGRVALLYPGADYVDIGDVEMFRESVASGYFAVMPDETLPQGAPENAAYDAELREVLRREITARLRDRLGRVGFLRLGRLEFVFSSQRTRIDGCLFGADRILFGTSPLEGDIYGRLDLGNNRYERLEADLSRRADLEARLDASLGEPYVLVQTRRRAIWRRSTAVVDDLRIVEALARESPVVLLEFGEIRRDDSYSSFEGGAGVRRISVSGFAEQSCLVHHARSCVFLTEGDFGSHIYVPPFLGRDVHAVAPRDVYDLGTTPIAFWNESVFRFGGSIHPIVAEELDDGRLAELARAA